MKKQLEQLSVFVPLAVVNDKKSLINMLANNGFLFDSQNISDEKLTEMVMNAIFNSNNFRNDFSNYIDSIANQLEYSNSDGFWSTGGAGGAISGLVGGALSVFGAIQVSKDQKAAATANAKANLALAQAQAQANQTQLEIAKLQLLTAQSGPKSNNTVLYIVLASVGVLAIGTTIFFVTRKK